MLTVSNYHYIRENFDHKYPSIFGVTPAQFKRQLELLKNEGSFISIQDFLSHTEDVLNSKENYYLITFDDGLKEQYTHAVPIMNKLNIDGLFFVNTMNHEEKKVSSVHKIHLLRSAVAPEEILKEIHQSYELEYSPENKEKAHSTYRWDTKESAEIKYLLNFLMPYAKKEQIVDLLFQKYFDESEIADSLYMSQQEVRELAKKRYIGNHTHSHKPLGLFDRSTIEYELNHSKDYLEQMTGEKIEVVSYPYGTAEASSKEVQELTKMSGHLVGFTALKGVNNDANNLFGLKRFDCNDLIGGKNYGN